MKEGNHIFRDAEGNYHICAVSEYPTEPTRYDRINTIGLKLDKEQIERLIVMGKIIPHPGEETWTKDIFIIKPI